MFKIGVQEVILSSNFKKAFMKLNIRNIHRDLGYLYVGLIISFALSGMFFNHRDSWHPEKYTVKITEIAVQMPAVDSMYPPDQLHMLNHLPSNFGAKAVQFG